MPQRTPHVLIVEDDARTAALVNLYLREAGFRTTVAHDGDAGLQAALATPPDLVILDLMLPGRDGWSVCKALREYGDVPILILSARQEEDDRLVGLGLGADDYVVKPFSPRELVLRVKAILRRAGNATTGTETVRIDHARRTAIANGREVALTPAEFALLDLLAASPGRTFERRELLDCLYPSGGQVVPKVIDVHIAKLRRKIEPEPRRPRHIVTVRGFGYRFEEGY